MKLHNKKIYKNYISGFIISIILTIIPFTLTTYYFYINKNFLILILTICAILQIFIHFIYFLHINFSSNKIWDTMALIFTTLIIIILVFGSVWIMGHLNHHVIHYK